jgi:D-alanyl-D-alanine carboxypeptidase
MQPWACRLGIVALLATGCGGRTSAPLEDGVRQLVHDGVPGAFVFARDGTRTQSAAAGFADLESGAKVEAGDRFRIGSVTKTFVATIVLQLAAEKRLHLDETVDSLLPGLLPDGERITLRDLLSHRSGLADVADDPTVLAGARSTWSPRRLIELAAHEPRTAAPGTAFHYSSTNYLVLGLVIERVTHDTLASQLEQRIIEPLRLHDTAYVPGRIRGAHVHGYSRPSHQGVVDPAADPTDLEARSARWAGGAGDLVSSAPDVARFLRALLGGRLLPPAQLREMEQLHSGYGLGLAVFTTPCGRAWGHTGSLNGLLTVAWTTRDGRRQIVAMANTFPLTVTADVALLNLARAAFCDG